MHFSIFCCIVLIAVCATDTRSFLYAKGFEVESTNIPWKRILSAESKSVFSKLSRAKNYEKKLFRELRVFKNPKFPLNMGDYFYQWLEYKRKYGKVYGSFVEEKRRFGIFMENHEQIRLHNLAFENRLTTFDMKLNKYSDMDLEEFVRTRTGYLPSIKEDSNTEKLEFLRPLNFQIPESVDWRQQGYVTPVKNQGPCGSCWAFGAIGSLEGQMFRKTKNLTLLSEQNLLDCSSGYGNEGCRGGWTEKAFDYVKYNGGVDTEESYPYLGHKAAKCMFKKESVGGTVNGYVNIAKNDEEELKIAVASVGPVSVSINVNVTTRGFKDYKSGVFYDSDCHSKTLNHAVLVVGYGTETFGGDYWLIKNSWGEDWGEDGFMKLARNRKNQCGVATKAIYPLV